MAPDDGPAPAGNGHGHICAVVPLLRLEHSMYCVRLGKQPIGLLFCTHMGAATLAASFATDGLRIAPCPLGHELHLRPPASAETDATAEEATKPSREYELPDGN